MDDELQHEIESYIDAHWDEVVADIDELVRVESVEDLEAATEGAPYGPGPREALTRALGIARRMGLRVHDCEGHVGYADLPGRSETQIGIIGHVDVVPAGTGWNYPAHEVTRKDGYLIGRGVLDDKGPLVVALHAVKFWRDRAAAAGEQLPYTVRVLFGANEETNMKDVDYYRAHHDDPAFLFTPDSQFPGGYGESGICSGTLKSAPIEGGDIIEL
ncbi:MAG: M20/M25/M40 family metallo-hydrolase, partial [Eggerthellaceae bacterium]|nr:M20/M25/M40 family metallo-hydrolase [Eggerthellaceae bacterium]